MLQLVILLEHMARDSTAGSGRGLAASDLATVLHVGCRKLWTHIIL